MRSRQHERGTSQERRYKRSHRRSPSSGRQHGHRERDRDRAHLAHPTSSRRTRLHRHHGSSSPSQERHRHRSPSTRSQVRNNTIHVLASIITRSCRLCFTASRDTRPIVYKQSIILSTPDLRKTYKADAYRTLSYLSTMLLKEILPNGLFGT